jgi:hypothetical protein
MVGSSIGARSFCQRTVSPNHKDDFKICLKDLFWLGKCCFIDKFNLTGQNLGQVLTLELGMLVCVMQLNS